MDETAPPKPKRKRHGGRAPGTSNKFTATIKARIEKSLDMVGGEKYLARVAITHPAAYLALLSRAMPLQVKADVSEFTYVVQTLAISNEPVPGVISTGIPPLRLVNDKASDGQ